MFFIPANYRDYLMYFNNFVLGIAIIFIAVVFDFSWI